MTPLSLLAGTTVYIYPKYSIFFLLFAPWVVFHLLLSSVDFIKIKCFKNFFRHSIRVSNGLDPDQDRHLVGPDLDPNRFKFSKIISRQQKSSLAKKELKKDRHRVLHHYEHMDTAGSRSIGYRDHQHKL